MKSIFKTLLLTIGLLSVGSVSSSDDKSYYYIIKLNQNKIENLSCNYTVNWFDLATSMQTDRTGRLKGYNFLTNNSEMACSYSISNPANRIDGGTINAISSGFNQGTATLNCNNGQWVLQSGDCSLHCNTSITGSVRTDSGRTCSFSNYTPLKSPHDSTISYSNSDAGNIGSVNYICNDGLWDFQNAECNAKICSGTVNWSVGANNCTATLSGEDGQSLVASDSAYISSGSGTGSAPFLCQGVGGSPTGNWIQNGTGTCNLSFDGACDNTQFDTCLPNRGNPINFTDNAISAFWNCSGSGLGNNSPQCSREKNDAITNGGCGTNLNSCLTGTTTNATTSGSNYIWSCAGSTGNRTIKEGITASCSLTIPNCGTANGTTISSLSNTTNAQTCNGGTINNYASNASTFTWQCGSADQSVSCSANKTSSCGSANGTITGTAPSSNLCGIGSPSTVSTGATSYTWSCSNGSSTSSCGATRTAVCNNGTFQGCSLGSASAFTSSNTNSTSTATWNCSNGSSTTACARAKTSPTNGVCGASNGSTTSTTPTSLCSSGAASSVTNGSSSYTWSCFGSNSSYTEMGGSSSSCSANKPTASCNNSSFGGCNTGTPAYTSGIGASTVTWTCTEGASTSNCSRTATTGASGSCGSANGTISNGAPSSNLCSSGYGSSSVTFSAGWYNWSCYGQSASQTNTSGSSSNCAATRQAICDNNNFQSCSFGIPSGYTSTVGSSTATWNCSNGASVSACSKSKLAGTNGACGASSGGTFSSAPTSLCSSGNASSVTTGSSNYTWTCSGSAATNTNLAGTTANCSANRTLAAGGVGSCGSAHNGISSSAPTGSAKCSSGYGSSTVTSSAGWYTWSCYGQPAGTNNSAGANASCQSTMAAVCNNSTFRGCSFGSASGYTSTVGSSTANWNCSNGASVIGCARSKTTAVNGVCGGSNGGTSSTHPTTGLCTSGTYVNTSDTTTQWRWSCNGSVQSDTQLGGTNATCASNKPPVGGTWVMIENRGEQDNRGCNPLQYAPYGSCPTLGQVVSHCEGDGPTCTSNCIIETGFSRCQ